MQVKSGSRPVWSEWAAAGLSMLGHAALLYASGFATGNAAKGMTGAAAVNVDSRLATRVVTSVVTSDANSVANSVANSGAVSVSVEAAAPLRGNTTESMATKAAALPPVDAEAAGNSSHVPGLAVEADTGAPALATETLRNVFVWRQPPRHYFDTHQLTEKPVPLHDLSAAQLVGLPEEGSHSAILTLFIADDGRIDDVEMDSTNLTGSELMLLAKGFREIQFVPGKIGSVAVRTRIKIEVTIESRRVPITPEQERF